MAILLDHVGFRICFSHLVGITTGQSVICINPVPIQKIDGKEEPKISLKFAKHAARYNEFGYKWLLISVLKLKLTVSLRKCCCWDVAFKHPISSWSVERVCLQICPSEFKKIPFFYKQKYRKRVFKRFKKRFFSYNVGLTIKHQRKKSYSRQ